MKIVYGNDLDNGKESRMKNTGINKTFSPALLPSEPVPLNSYYPYLQVLKEETENHEMKMKKKEIAVSIVPPVKAPSLGSGSSYSSYFTSSLFDMLSFRSQSSVPLGNTAAAAAAINQSTVAGAVSNQSTTAGGEGGVEGRHSNNGNNGNEIHSISWHTDNGHKDTDNGHN